MKAIEGRYTGLLDKNVMDKKRSDEEEFKAKVMANPEWKEAYGGAWAAIAEAVQKAAPRMKEQFYHSTDSQLANVAATIVDYVAEIKKPDGERLAGYHEAQLRFHEAAPVLPRADLSGHGDRAYDRRARTGHGGPRTGRSVPQDRAQRPLAEGGRDGN